MESSSNTFPMGRGNTLTVKWTVSFPTTNAEAIQAGTISSFAVTATTLGPIWPYVTIKYSKEQIEELFRSLVGGHPEKFGIRENKIVISQKDWDNLKKMRGSLCWDIYGNIASLGDREIDVYETEDEFTWKMML